MLDSGSTAASTVPRLHALSASPGRSFAYNPLQVRPCFATAARTHSRAHATYFSDAPMVLAEGGHVLAAFAHALRR